MESVHAFQVISSNLLTKNHSGLKQIVLVLHRNH